MDRFLRRLIAALALIATPACADARDALGLWHDWAALRDPGPPSRCYAIALATTAHQRGHTTPAPTWMTLTPGPSGQVLFHWHLSTATTAPVHVTVGPTHLTLHPQGQEATPSDPKTIATLTAALPHADTATLTTHTWQAQWTLTGAPTALAAARLGCG